MSGLYSRLRPLLFRFDAESVHGLVLQSLRFLEAGLARTAALAPAFDPLLTQELFGVHFPNPVGLAAGLDKNAALPHVWPALGFGFAELGTVTALPQAGNPRPRLFRLPADSAIINRMGFNNAGATKVAQALRRRLDRQRPAVPIGINIGKSKITPLNEAVGDYCASFRLLAGCADYVAVNVSSPNTPGLRELQTEVALEELLRALQEENGRLAQAGQRPPKPILVKVAPDLGEPDLAAVVAVAERCQLAGIIATNTTIQRPHFHTSSPLVAEAGGLSGAPLRQPSTAVIRTLRRLSNGQLPIIGVGGIFTAEDAYEKILAGASLVQAYTGFIYEGPSFARRIAAGLHLLLNRDGCKNIRDAIGAA